MQTGCDLHVVRCRVGRVAGLPDEYPFDPSTAARRTRVPAAAPTAPKAAEGPHQHDAPARARYGRVVPVGPKRCCGGRALQRIRWHDGLRIVPDRVGRDEGASIGCRRRRRASRRGVDRQRIPGRRLPHRLPGERANRPPCRAARARRGSKSVSGGPPTRSATLRTAFIRCGRPMECVRAHRPRAGTPAGGVAGTCAAARRKCRQRDARAVPVRP